MNVPTTLIIPDLVSGDEVQLYWKQMTDAAEYELEACFDEDFASASLARSWESIEGDEEIWKDYGKRTWMAIEATPAQGPSWNTINFNGYTWTQHDALQQSWRNCSVVPSKFTIYKGAGIPFAYVVSGLMWQDIETRGRSWQQGESDQLIWSALEQLKQGGLSWDSAGSRFLDLDTWESQINSWNEFEAMNDSNDLYLSYSFPVPEHARYVVFRFRAIGTNVTPSVYLYSTLLPVIYKDQIACSGMDGISVQIAGDSVRMPERKLISVLYDPKQIQVSAEQDGSAVSAHINNLSDLNGNLRIRTEIDGDSDLMYSGQLAEILGRSLSDLDTEIKMTSQANIN